jgi:hypothetical protein
MHTKKSRRIYSVLLLTFLLTNLDGESIFMGNEVKEECERVVKWERTRRFSLNPAIRDLF